MSNISSFPPGPPLGRTMPLCNEGSFSCLRASATKGGRRPAFQASPSSDGLFPPGPILVTPPSTPGRLHLRGVPRQDH